jgi:NADH-quinone oxidoreductase subunit C
MELARLYPAWVAGVVRSPQETTQATRPAALLTALRGSLLHRGYLSDLFGSDYPGRARRIQLTWSVWSYHQNERYLIQAAVPRGVSTTTGLWPSANWFEREAWEMFGTRFEGHPDLRRLLTDYGFVGRPLLKDFPVSGYQEVRYSERAKRVVMRPVSFTQEFRVFEFQSPWQN